MIIKFKYIFNYLSVCFYVSLSGSQSINKSVSQLVNQSASLSVGISFYLSLPI